MNAGAGARISYFRKEMEFDTSECIALRCFCVSLGESESAIVKGLPYYLIKSVTVENEVMSNNVIC